MAIVSHTSFATKIYILLQVVLLRLPDFVFQSNITDSKSIFRVLVSAKSMACRQLPQLLKKRLSSVNKKKIFNL